MAPVAVVPVGSSSPDSHFFLPNHVEGHQIVVKSEEEATDTGSLLTHFICLALGLLSIKQMERHCIITRVERARQPSSLKGGASGFCLFFPASTLKSIREAWPP